MAQNMRLVPCGRAGIRMLTPTFMFDDSMTKTNPGRFSIHEMGRGLPVEEAAEEYGTAEEEDTADRTEERQRQGERQTRGRAQTAMDSAKEGIRLWWWLEAGEGNNAIADVKQTTRDGNPSAGSIDRRNKLIEKSDELISKEEIQASFRSDLRVPCP